MTMKLTAPQGMEGCKNPTVVTGPAGTAQRPHTELLSSWALL